MKSFVTKILMVAGLISLVPFFSYAASLSCFTDYTGYLTGENITFTASIEGSVDTFEWNSVPGTDTYITSFGVGSHDVTVTASSTDGLLSDTCTVNIYDAAGAPGAPGAPTISESDVSCSVDNDMAPIGQDVIWTSSFSGPLGPYTITWEGTDSKSGNGEIFTTTYNTPFKKYAWITNVTSRYGADTSTHDLINKKINCINSVDIIPAAYSNPENLVVTGTCSALNTDVHVNDSVTWDASNLIVNGSVDQYELVWTDASDNSNMGTGTSTSKVYSSTGEKSAYVTVVDGARTVPISCSNTVTVSNRSDGGSSHNNNNDDDNATSTASTTPSTATSTATSTNSTASSTPNNDANGNGIDDSLEGGNDSNDNGGYNVIDGYIYNRDQNPGTYSEDVANLQSRLTEEGFYNGLIGGFFGPATEQALKDYQKANGLTETGILDAATRFILNSRFDSIASTTTINDIPSKIYNLSASAIGALQAAYDFIGGKLFSTLLALIIIVVTSILYLKPRFTKEK
jgi:hypothetical protein